LERLGKAPVRSVIAGMAAVGVTLVLALAALIAAPMLTVGAPVELPRTETGDFAAPDETVTVSIDRNGGLRVGQVEVASDGLVEHLTLGGDARDNPVHVRAHAEAPYQAVARTMAQLSAAGFTELALITDTAVADGEG